MLGSALAWLRLGCLELLVLGLTLLLWVLFIFLLVGLKQACIPNFSFLGCLEVELLVLGLTIFWGGSAKS